MIGMVKNGRRGHHQVPENLALPLKVRQPQRHGKDLGAGEVDQRRLKVVPMEEESRDCHHRERGLERGITTLAKISNSEAPSIRAASHNSSGMVYRTGATERCRRRWQKKVGTISGRKVLPHLEHVVE